MVRCDEDAGVFLGVIGSDRGGVRAENVLEGAESLGAELVPVADEEGAAELAGVGDVLEEVDGDESLPRSGGQGKQGAFLASGDLLQDGADGGVLIVAAGRLATGVADEERAGRRSGQGRNPGSFRSGRGDRQG